MNCRNCGAAMQPVGGAAYFRCTHCGTFEFPTTNEDRVATLNEVTSFPCPVCEKSLGKAAVEGHSACYCGTCRGVLTTNDQFSGILLKLRAEYADRPSVPRSIDPVELRRRVSCPKCRRVMDAHPYGGGGNVVIDTCHRCHLIWLDAGEMETIARHKAKGGTLGPGAGLLVAQHSGPPREPQSPLRWGGEDDFERRPSLWELLSRLF